MKLKNLLLKVSILIVLAISVFMCTSCFGLCFALSMGKPSHYKEKGLTFELTDDGDGYYLSEVDVELRDVEIPEKFKGKPVTGIDSYAFAPYVSYGCGSEKQAVSPVSLTIPDTVTYIGDCAFEDNVIKTVVYDGSIEDWLKVDIVNSTPFSENTQFFVDGKEVTSLTLPESITEVKDYVFSGLKAFESVILHGDVTRIGAYAFSGTGIKNIEIPDSVDEVGEGAFKNTRLKEITLSANLKVLDNEIFSGCEQLETVNLKCGIEEIGRCAFEGCISLKNIDLSFSTFTCIPFKAFSHCSNLNAITVPETVESIEEYAFYDCVRLYEIYNYSHLNIVAGRGNFGEIAKYAVAVYDDENIDRVVFERGEFLFGIDEYKRIYLLKYTGNGDNVVLPASFDGENYAIKDFAFSGNKTMKYITLPVSVTSIGKSAFSYCESLEELRGGAGVFEIGDNAFEYCKKLISDIPAKVWSIGEYAYCGCESLKKITLPEGVIMIDDYTFKDCKNLAEVAFSEKITEIGISAFENCGSLGHLVFPESLKEISINAFYQSGIKSIEFTSVKKINDYAFSSVQGLEKVVLPEGLISLGYGAFSYCKDLKEIYLPSTLTDISNVFSYCANLEKIEVAEGNPVYRSANNCVITENKVVLGSVSAEIPTDGSVTIIGERAFAGRNITSVTLPESIEIIAPFAFYSCKKLTTVYLNNSVKEIGADAFYYCDVFECVYYDGDSLQFNDIYLDSNWVNHSSHITIRCKDTVFTYNY